VQAEYWENLTVMWPCLCTRDMPHISVAALELLVEFGYGCSG
jgi:hypothetical protein